MLSSGYQAATPHAFCLGLGGPKSTDLCLELAGPKSMDLFAMFPYPLPFSFLPPPLPPLPWPPAHLPAAVRVPPLATSLAAGGREVMVPRALRSGAAIARGEPPPRLDCPSHAFLGLAAAGQAGQAGRGDHASLVRFTERCSRKSFSVESLLGSRAAAVTSLMPVSNAGLSSASCQHDDPRLSRSDPREGSYLRDNVNEDSGRDGWTDGQLGTWYLTPW